MSPGPRTLERHRTLSLAPRLALLAAVWAAVLAGSVAGAEELADVGGQAKMFRLPVYNAEAVGASSLGLDRFAGPDAKDKDTRVVLMSFMASFCAPCKKEMPYLQQLHERHSADGLRIVMVSIDTEPEGQKIVEELIALNKVTFPVLKDRFNIVARRWLGTKSPLPSAFLIGPDGKVKTVHRGYSEEIGAILAKELESELKLSPGMVALPSQPVVVPAAADATKTGTTKPAKAKKQGKPQAK